MKIEKINDNKIRCTLTSADLAERNLKLSELAYGTEKARSLFQDMMLEANQQFGFNVDNAPLMVEAVPVAPDSIVLITRPYLSENGPFCQIKKSDKYTEQYQANANNANYNNPQQTYYAPNGQPQYGQNYAQPYDPPQGTKSRIAAGVLAILFGVFGVHNFYIGKTGLGIAQLAITVCSCGTLAIVSEIWGIIEGVRLLQGTIYTDGHGMKFVD